MRKVLSVIFTALSVLFLASPYQAKGDDEIAVKTTSYFEGLFNQLKSAAEQDPSADTFRRIMKPAAESIKGFFGATLISPDFVIRQVYNPTHFLARGYDLKKVKELEYFYGLMKENPAPQLSEPGHGSIVQPRLIAMRYPVIKEGNLTNIISMMVRTDNFLEASGLDKCKAYKIICLGKVAESKGELSKDYKEISLKLPSTEWSIRYEK